ncbi:MAG: DUF4097 family beta strand repeat protein [Selenomonadales bacterium]|nr:DUF4097 family beta strand repeat protein [Selenomonadales bacterium]
MGEETKMILEMLRDGKITADEATRLLNAAQPARRTHESEGAFFSDLRDVASEVVQRARKEAKEAVRRANEILREEQRGAREQARELAEEARDEMREKLREAKQRLKEMRRELKQRLRHESATADLAEETEEEIESMQDEIDEMQDEVEEIEDELEELEEEEEEEEEDEDEEGHCEPTGGVLASVISALGGGQTYNWQENLSGEIPNVPVPHIVVRGVNGRVIVELTDDAKWHLTAEKSARAANAAEAKALSRNLYSVETTAEGLVIAAKQVFGQARAVNFHLRLPQNHIYDLDLSAVNGSVRVKGVAAKRLRASTTNGQVAVESMASEISLSSVNGRVELYGAAASVACRTVNGSLSVTCPTLHAGTMALDTVNGSITLRLANSQDVGVKIKGANVHGSVEAEGLGLKVDVVRHTVGRKLRAESEGDFSAWLEIEAKSVHGSINIAPAR